VPDDKRKNSQLGNAILKTAFVRNSFFFALAWTLAGCAPKPEPAAEVGAPAWAREVVWYQIFPERFRNGDPNNDPTRADIEGAWPADIPQGWRITPWTSDWYKPQPWEQPTDDRGFYYHVQHRRYGGDLQGVIDRLDYLVELGVNAIYFNPLFESPSLHKYDATMYRHIDNNFGPDPEGDRRVWAQEDPADPTTWRWTSADSLFLRLLDEAHRRGMRVIIDGVFNHVGKTFWAFRDVVEKQKVSPYKDWFIITSWDDPLTAENEFDYAGWANVRELPEIREDENGLVAGPREHIRAVVRRWMDPNGDGDPTDGIDGWRLDVAEMVKPAFWREFRRWVREINPEAYLTGEVWWEDWPSNKMFNPEPWLRGDMFDAVMNYRWSEAVMRFFIDRDRKISASDFDRRLARLRADLAEDVNHVLMNLMDSHDTDRLASQIVNPDLPFDHLRSPKDNEGYDVRKPVEEERAVQKLIVTFQMTYVGAPMVYYGDEAGMWGGDDPDCRKPMVWPDLRYEPEIHHPFGKPRPRDEVVFDRELFETYRKLIAIRRAHPALKYGDYRTLLADDDRDLFAFERSEDDDRVIVLLNNDSRDHDVRLPELAGKWTDLLSGREVDLAGAVSTAAKQAMILVPAR
jgi:glycosidase